MVLATAAWQSAGGVQQARRTAEGTWEAPTDLAGPGRQAFSPEVVANAEGGVVAAWHSAVGERVVTARFLPRTPAAGPGPGPGTVPPAAVALAPQILRLTLRPPRISRSGAGDLARRTTLRVTLGAAASVRVTIRRPGAGRPVRLVRSLPAGRGRIRLGATARLAPGTYRVQVVATNPAGRSRARTRLVVRP